MENIIRRYYVSSIQFKGFSVQRGREGPGRVEFRGKQRTSGRWQNINNIKKVPERFTNRA